MDALKIENLTKTYPNFTLDNVSFSVPGGSVVGLIGENGAGKTTVLKAALGLMKPDRGRVEIFGKIAVSSYMFGHTVQYLHYGLGLLDFVPGGKPQIVALVALQNKLFHNISRAAYRSAQTRNTRYWRLFLFYCNYYTIYCGFKQAHF